MMYKLIDYFCLKCVGWVGYIICGIEVLLGYIVLWRRYLSNLVVIMRGLNLSSLKSHPAVSHVFPRCGSCGSHGRGCDDSVLWAVMQCSWVVQYCVSVGFPASILDMENRMRIHLKLWCQFMWRPVA
jgi:hypothetical protein